MSLITSPTHMVMKAAERFKDPPVRVNELWQTDFSYLKVVHWGWYYLNTVLDYYSRYIIAWELGRILCSDSGSCYVSGDLTEFLKDQAIDHVRGKPHHPQTQGKIERYHRTLKNIIRLEQYYIPEELETQIAAFVDHYNNHRYHEPLDNVTPADVYFGRKEERNLRCNKLF